MTCDAGERRPKKSESGELISQLVNSYGKEVKDMQKALADGKTARELMEGRLADLEGRLNGFLRQWDGDGANSDGWRDLLRQLDVDRKKDLEDDWAKTRARLERIKVIMDKEGGMDAIYYAKELKGAQTKMVVDRIKFTLVMLGTLGGVLTVLAALYSALVPE